MGRRVVAFWLFHDVRRYCLPPDPFTNRLAARGTLSQSEMLFIMVLFHLSPFKHFKVFYHYGIGQQRRACFDEIPRYERFVSLMPRLFARLMALLHKCATHGESIFGNP
jgi:hypothetical protein